MSKNKGVVDAAFRRCEANILDRDSVLVLHETARLICYVADKSFLSAKNKENITCGN